MFFHPLLENWKITMSGHKGYLVSMLHGQVYDSLNFRDGDFIFTSPIQSASGRTVTTKTGTVYTLGKPNAAWAERNPEWRYFLESQRFVEMADEMKS
jgi:hypothetical protein